jgi:hypothetical protein
MFPWVFHSTFDFPSASCTPENQEKLNPTGGKLFQGGPGWRKIWKIRGNKNMLNSMCFHYFGAGTECLLKCHLILGNFSLGWDMPRKPAHHSSCLSRESALVLALDRRGAFWACGHFSSLSGVQSAEGKLREMWTTKEQQSKQFPPHCRATWLPPLQPGGSGNVEKSGFPWFPVVFRISPDFPSCKMQMENQGECGKPKKNS